MKQNINFSKLLFLLFLAFTISSCHKDEPEPDLVPITMTGENTMGFYVDGVYYARPAATTLVGEKTLKSL